MNIDGLALPNPDFGYETTVKLPFHFSKLANGKISACDEGVTFDRYSVKCSCVMPLDKLYDFFTMYSGTHRGQELTLSGCQTTGFYPFTPVVLSVNDLGTDRYKVVLDKVDKKGQVDTLAKGLRVDFEMIMSYNSINFALAHEAAPEGSLALDSMAGVVIDGVRYPVNGFTPSEGYSVYSHQMYGGAVNTIDYDQYRYGLESKGSGMTITANAGTAVNVIRALLLNIRSAPFTITVPTNYHVFGMGTGVFSVRLTSDVLKVRHTRFDEFEISLNVAEA